MQITATARSTGLDVTPALAANQSETIDLNITVPDQNPRGGDRSFYLARIRLGSPGQITGALVITVSIPKQRVTWGRLLLNDGTGNPAPLQAIVGSGRSFTRRVTFSANSEIPDFAIKSNSDRITVSAVPDVLAPNQQRTVVLTFNAPIVNRRTRMDVSLTPASGLSPLPTALRMKVIVNPAEITWGPPQVRATLNAETQELQEKTLTVVSNVDIPGVSFVTQDVGLVPILSPLDPVNLRAGVPQEVRMRLCPGYAPTTYFLGLTAYQGSKPLNQRLQIKMTVTGDAARIPALPPGAQDPCARR
jgi:hypothetical protein